MKISYFTAGGRAKGIEQCSFHQHKALFIPNIEI